MRKFLIALAVVFGGISCLYADNSTEPKREKLYHESLRPQFHYTARYWDDYLIHPQRHQEGWINDVNGLVYHQGEYHFFAQRWWSAWLHAVSTDLIHWKELRPAFGKGGKFGGTQSGGGVVDLHNCSGLGGGKEPPMIAFWSSTDSKSQCISYSLNRGRTWTKYDKNPVLVHHHRDPTVFWYEPDQKWIMILYGPTEKAHDEKSRGEFRYGFNGEGNDAHRLGTASSGQWVSSAIRLSENGRVTVTDQHGTGKAVIDSNKQNLGAERFCVGAKANGSEFFKGDIAEILVYDRALSDVETRNLLASLQSKISLSKSSSPKSSILKDGLVLHLDAASAIATSENAVSLWKDLSGKGNHVAQTVSGSMPKWIGPQAEEPPAVHFDGKQFLQGPAVLAEGDDTFTIVAFWRRNHAKGSQVVCEQNTQTPQTGRRAALLSVEQGQQSKGNYWLFSSTNLLDWQKLDTSIPHSFECPDMFELPVDKDPAQMKWVVVDGRGDYVLGRFDGKQFTTEVKKQKGDYGRNFYATRTFQCMPQSDPRRIQLVWMRGGAVYPKNMPFNQQISFPCELTLRRLPQGIVLCRYPIREISKIYRDEFLIQDRMLKPGENPLDGLDGELFDIKLVIDVAQSTGSEVVFDLCGNTVTYNLPQRILESVGSKAPLEPRDGLVEIRILMDRLSIETFGNQGEVSITNVAQQKSSSPPLKLNAVGGEIKIVSLVVHKLESIWD